MINLNNIHSLTDFQRNSREHIDRLKATGLPEVLTVNGQAELVIQDAKAYQELLSAAEAADTIRILKKRLKSYRTGKRGRPAAELLSELEDELNS